MKTFSNEITAASTQNRCLISAFLTIALTIVSLYSFQFIPLENGKMSMFGWLFIKLLAYMATALCFLFCTYNIIVIWLISSFAQNIFSIQMLFVATMVMFINSSVIIIFKLNFGIRSISNHMHFQLDNLDDALSALLMCARNGFDTRILFEPTTNKFYYIDISEDDEIQRPKKVYIKK